MPDILYIPGRISHSSLHRYSKRTWDEFLPQNQHSLITLSTSSSSSSSPSDTVQMKCGQWLGRASGNDGGRWAGGFVCPKSPHFLGRLQCGKLQVAMLQCCKLQSCVCITITIYRTTETGNVTLAPFAFLWLAKDFRVCGTPQKPLPQLLFLLLLLKRRPNALSNLCTVFVCFFLFSKNSVSVLYVIVIGLALPYRVADFIRSSPVNPLASHCHASHCYQYQQKISSQGTQTDADWALPSPHIGISTNTETELILYSTRKREATLSWYS